MTIAANLLRFAVFDFGGVVLCVRSLCFCVLGLKGEHHRLWLELGRYLLQVLQVVSDI